MDDIEDKDIKYITVYKDIKENRVGSIIILRLVLTVTAGQL